MEEYRKLGIQALIFYLIGIIYFYMFRKYNMNTGTFIYFYVSTFYLVFQLINLLINEKKQLKIYIAVGIIMFVLSAIVFRVIDTKRYNEDKRPLFAYMKTTTNYYDYDIKTRMGIYYNYYGFGYKMTMSDDNKIKSLGGLFKKNNYSFQTFEINDEEEYYYGRYFKSDENDVQLHLEYDDEFFLDNKSESVKGTFFVNDDVFTFTNDDQTKWECTMSDNKFDLHCDKYANIFMK